MGFTKNFEIWHGASLGRLIRIQEKQFEGPCEDHVLAIKGQSFGHFYEKGPQDTPSKVKFGIEHLWAH